MAEVKAFLNALPPSETDLYDLKQEKQKSVKTAQSFGSFANGRGGIVIYGINDERKPLGLSPKIDLFTQITNDLNLLQPGIPAPNIQEHKVFFGRPKKCIFIYMVKPSLSLHRPHFLEEKIPIRHNGRPLGVKSGLDLRNYFFSSHSFDGRHIEQVKFEFQLLKDFRNHPNRLSVWYFRSIKSYLSNRKEEYLTSGIVTTGIDNLKNQLTRIEATIIEIETLHYSSTPTNPNAVKLLSLDEKLSADIDQFIPAYEKEIA